MRENLVSDNGGAVSILLSGAELAEFKSSANLQLFWCQDGAEEPFESEVELRSKSGISVESSAVPFSLWNRSEYYDAGFSSNAENRRRLLDSEGFSASIPPIVLKSRAVVEAEKQSKPNRAQDRDCLLPEKKFCSSSKPKHRAVSMDETSLNQLRTSRKMSGNEELGPLSSRDDPCNRSRRICKKSEQNPLPLPLPPGSPARKSKPRHRRHVSIDLRASPAAKFRVQLMPWEMPEDHSSFSGRHSSAGRCFVPFKWEEVPGKPKSSSISTNSVNNHPNNNNGVNFKNKLRLPPRLQQLDQPSNVDMSKPAVSSSPTSILDHGVESSQSSMDSSFTSSPNAGTAEEIHDCTEKKKFQVHSKVRAFLALVIWTRKACEEEAGRADSGCVPKVTKQKKTNPASYQSISSSWSPSPRPSWLRSYSGLEIHHRSNRRRLRRMKRSNNSVNWGFGKLTSGCNMVSRAVRFRWWRRSTGVKLNRQSAYKPLLCSVGNDSAAFACS